MPSLLQTERLQASEPEAVLRAAQILRAGGTVAFPTETVYGLGANALDAEAVEKIFTAKQRPHWDPLIVHIASLPMLAQIAPLPPGRAGDLAQTLVDKFWPGPLTLLLPRSLAIPDAVTAGRPLVAVRMPAHPIALELLRQAGLPIAAPSANTFGHTSPTSAAHVLADLDGRIHALLDGGPTSVGLESTVIEILRQPGESWESVTIYREGAIDAEMLEQIVGAGDVHRYRPGPMRSTPESLPSPGVAIRHYAPRARLLLVGGPDAHALSQTRTSIADSLVDPIDRATTATSRVGVLLPDGWNPSGADLVFRWGPWHDPAVLAQRLYAGLRELDDGRATVIVCPVPEGHGIAEAIRDRLHKAAH